MKVLPLFLIVLAVVTVVTGAAVDTRPHAAAAVGILQPTPASAESPRASAGAATAVGAGGSTTDAAYQQQFAAYKQRFHRRYKTPASEKAAFAAFKKRAQRAEQLNQKVGSGRFNAAASPLGDKDETAMRKLHGGKPRNNSARLKVWKGPKTLKKSNIPMPGANVAASTATASVVSKVARAKPGVHRFTQLSSRQAPLPDPHAMPRGGGDNTPQRRRGGDNTPQRRRGGNGTDASSGVDSADLLDRGWTVGPGLSVPGLTWYFSFLNLFPPIVRNQEGCQSCYAVAATEHVQAVLSVISMLPTYSTDRGMYTSANQIAAAFQTGAAGPGGPNARLSAQQIIDCARTSVDTGCNGGTVIGAFDFMAKNGVNLANDYAYPLDGTQHECAPFKRDANGNGGRLYMTTTSYFVIQPCVAENCPGNPDAENALIHYWQNPPNQNPRTGQHVATPVIAYVDASNWDTYTGGIYDASTCSSSGTAAAHIVQIVGYGQEIATKKLFWLIRNSWGADWGESGHIRLPVGVNACGLTNYVVAALVKSDISASDAAAIRDAQAAAASLAQQQAAIMAQFQSQMAGQGYSVSFN